MENQKSVSTKSKPQAVGMFEFFYGEFETLRAKTGIRQWEQLNEGADAARVIHDIIDFMCQECNKPPFDIVKPEVKQRVISRAIVEDNDFIGLNAKFVRKALNAWWSNNGDRIIEERNRKEAAAYQRVELSSEQKQKIDRLANAYVAQLLQGDGPQPVPKLKPAEIAREGAEWQSELERKGTNYKDPHTPEWYALRDKIRREASEFYKNKYTLSGMKIYPIRDQEIFAQSKADAEEIFKRASDEGKEGKDNLRDTRKI